MKFGYYRRLGPRERRVYDESDARTSVRLPNAAALHGITARLAARLAADDRPGTELASQALVDGVLGRLRVSPVQVRVLAVRPTSRNSELHGLYEYGGKRPIPIISVWMRTAQRRQVVAFRTFLRTLLHEVVHHLDYRFLNLADSYHTQGFYKRAEGLYRQLTPRSAEPADLALAAESAPPALLPETGVLPATGADPSTAPPSMRIPYVPKAPRRGDPQQPRPVERGPTASQPTKSEPAKPRPAQPRSGQPRSGQPRSAQPARPVQPTLFDLD